MFKRLIMLRAECIRIKNLVLDCQFRVSEDFAYLEKAYLNGVDISHVITEQFTAELIEEFKNNL